MQKLIFKPFMALDTNWYKNANLAKKLHAPVS